MFQWFRNACVNVGLMLKATSKFFEVFFNYNLLNYFFKTKNAFFSLWAYFGCDSRVWVYVFREKKFKELIYIIINLE